MIVWLVLLALVGADMRTEVSQRRSEIMREVTDDVAASDRYVNLSVLVRVVARPDAANAALPDIELPNGAPAKLIREHKLGGWADTKSTPPRMLERRWDDPRVWFATVEQAEALFHNDPRKLAQLIHGSEGAGKTRLMAMWQFRMWLKHFGEHREGGQTAPTLKRLGAIAKEMRSLFAPNWFRYVSRDDFEGFIYCDGTRCRFVSTHRQSASQGSPLQSFNFAWLGRDELQDQIEVHEDCESRGRAARRMVVDGRAIVAYWQLATATAKDSSDWRTLKGQLVSGGTWIKRDLSIFRTPFVERSFLDDKQRIMSSREFMRRYGDPATGLIVDLPPELQLYWAWQRQKLDGSLGNLRPIPITAKKITSLVLSRKTGNRLHSLLGGHDPGAAKGATIYLDAFQLPKVPDPVWWVRGERLHKRQTTEQSGLEILKDAKDRGCNVRPDGEIIHVRAMPVGQAEDKPSEDLYRIFKRVGLDCRAAQFRKDGTGTGVIKKDDRIDMLNALFEKERLFIECDDMKRPVAPALVRALETMERDERGRAEWEKKDEDDLSDAPAALGYALWPFEKAGAGMLQAATRRSMQ